MFYQRIRQLALLLAGLSIGTGSQALGLDGTGSIMVIPIAAATATFTSTIYIRNPNSGTLNLQVQYIGGDGSASPGLRACTPVSVLPGRSVSLSLIGLCPLNPGSNFGLVQLTDISAGEIRSFHAYVRVENPDSIGFGVESFALGGFDGSPGEVIGLRSGPIGRTTFTTGCFVATRGEPTSYEFRLFNGTTGLQIGQTLSGNLGTNQLVRLLDVFSLVQAPAGSYDNVNAVITSGGSAILISYCNVQENTRLSADFRIAKRVSPYDIGRARAIFHAGDAFTVSDSKFKNVHLMYLRHPDFYSCRLEGANTASLELAVRNPNGTIASGGTGIADTGIQYTGEKGTVASGFNAGWIILVQTRDGVSGPLSYGLYCQTGSGGSYLDALPAEDRGF